MRERFAVNGEMISEEAFLQGFLAVWDALQETNSANTGDGQRGEEAPQEFVLNFYEYLFCMALLCFAEEKPDYCIMMTAWGEDWMPRIMWTISSTVITRISLDHVQYLGDTTAKIAAEKGRDPAPRCSGGVSGRGCGCQCGNLPQSVRTWCDTDTGVEKGLYFPWISGRNTLIFPCALSIIIILVLLCIPLHAHQMEKRHWQCGPWKCCFAVRTCLTAECVPHPGCPTVEEIRQGILGCFWQGRMEEVLPEVYVDGAHNDDGIRAFLDTVEQDGCTEGRRLLFGVAADKDCRHMIQRVITSGLFDRIAFTHMRTARSLSLEELKGLLTAYPEDRFTMYTEADTALRTEVSGRQPGERLYIAGSLYLVGEIKESLDHDNFEEELKKFHPSLEVEDAEEAIYNQDLTDAADLLVKM